MFPESPPYGKTLLAAAIARSVSQHAAEHPAPSPHSDEVWSKLVDLAKARKTDIASMIAEEIGLEEAFVQAKQAGGRMLIEKNGRVQELVLTLRG